MNGILVLVLVLQALLTPNQMRVARIVMGETGGHCGHEADVLIVHMIDRGVTIWYGNAEPDAEAMAVALTGLHEPDPAPEAAYLFSDSDLQLASVQELVRGSRLVRVFECAGGLHLSAYAAGRE